MKKLALSLLAGLLSVAAFADKTVTAVPVKSKVVTVTADQIQRLAALYPNPKGINEIKREEIETFLDKRPNPASPQGPQWPPASAGTIDPAALFGSGARPPVTADGTVKIRPGGPLFGISTSWDGPNLGSSGYIPPDSTGDAGLTSVIVCANGRIRSYTRAGVLGSINATMDAFFTPIAPSLGVSDPRVIFDRLTNRWFIAGISTNASLGNRVLLAWSNQENVNAGGLTWTMFGFVPEATTFADYETLGVDANGVYVGTNKFTTTAFVNCNMYALPKASLLAGSPAVANLGTTIGAAGMFTPQPCTNDDPAATSALFIGVDAASYGLLVARRVAFTAPSTFTVSGDINITVNATQLDGAVKARIPSSNATARFASVVDDRLFQARLFKDASGVTSLWTAHNTNCDNAGNATATTSSGTSTNRYGSRWYQIANPLSGTIAVTQQGTVFDSTAGATNLNHWIPSVAMNRQGHAFMGLTRGGGNAAANTGQPSVGGAQRLSGDPLGTMTNLGVLAQGANYYLAENTTNGQRWGDYSTTVLDPRDGMSIWTFQEYCNASNSWTVRAIKMLSAAPTVTGFSPSSMTQGVTGNVVVTGTGIFDPDASFPDHLSFSFGANVTVNSVTYNSPTQATVNITVGGTAATGARTVTLTNPDGQTATGSFTINQALKTVSGTLSLESFGGPVTSLPFIAELRNSSTNALIETINISGLGSGNSFSFTTNQAAGTYKLRIRGATRFLARSQTVTLSSTGATGLSYSLLNGDCDSDNAVGTFDFNVLRAAWGSTPSDSNWNAAADLDGDNVVGLFDFNIMRTNWGVTGDN